MMKKLMTILTLLLFIAPMFNYSQLPDPPPLVNRFTKATSHQELESWIRSVRDQQKLMKAEVIGQSAEGRNLVAMLFSSGYFGQDSSKVKVLIFAQQHGNEQSGKEGSLLLAAELMRPENYPLFEHIDLALIPQVNPDGSEKNQRRNSRDIDLNRNHLVLTEAETQALHTFFDRYKFEVTLDVHEYSPYSKSWEKWGYRKNSDVTIGATTNLNVPQQIRKFSFEQYVPYFLAYVSKQNFSTFHYCPGGPPVDAILRYSTFDINDGRQSFGIQNTLSFIQEGMNGRDDSIENMQHRALGQKEGMMALLTFVRDHNQEIKSIVGYERSEARMSRSGEMVTLQASHVSDGTVLKMPLLSLSTGKDTVVSIRNWCPVVKSLHDAVKPRGYLIPRDCTLLKDWALRHKFSRELYSPEPGDVLEQYQVESLKTIDFEGDTIADPVLTVKKVKVTKKQYYFYPASGDKALLLILGLEPKSMTGLATYPPYSGYLQPGKAWPVIRVVTKKKR